MSDTSPVEMTHDLGHYLRPMRRHIRLITFFVAGGLFLGLAAAILKSPTYTASSRVYVQPDIIDAAGVNPTAGRTSTPVNMDTEAQVLKSLPTATTAAKLLHNTASPTKLLSRLSVTVPPNTQILKISYSAHTTAAAIDGANALANAYLQNREDAATEYQTSRIDVLTSQQADAQAQLVKDKKAFRNATPSTPVANTLSQAILNDQNHVNGFNDQITSVQAGSTIPGRVVSKGVLGGSSPNQTRAIYALGGLVLGILFGIAAASLRERLDKTVRYEDDLARDHVRLLAEVHPRKAVSGRKRQAAEESEALARSRVIQRMAAAIGSALGDGGGSIYLAELSRTAMDDRIDEQLAAELSRFGSTTEIITLGSSPILNRGVQRQLPTVQAAEPVGVEASANGSSQGGIGTSDLISPDHHASSEMLGWPVPAPAPAVSVIEATATRTAPEPIREVAPASPVTVTGVTPEPFDPTTSLLQQVQAGLSRARYVILTGSDIPHGSEAYVLASLSQVTVIVAETGVTQRTALTELVEQVEITPSRILGGLLWRPWAHKDRTPATKTR